MNMVRRLMSQYWRKRYIKKVRATALKCGTDLFVGGYTQVNSNTVLGNRVSFNGMTILGNGKVTIGNNFHSGQGCYIITDNHDYDHGDSIPYDSKRSIPEETVIEDNVWLGVGVIVLPGAHIGEGAIIQAGSVVAGNIEPFAIAGGHPARKFKERDVEHYNQLKKEGKVF